MGSFNQLCIITGTPITYGDAVMVGSTVPSVPTKGENCSSELQFGFPLLGHYDDYGEAKIKNDIHFQFREGAWERQEFFKEIVFKDFMSHSIHVAASAKSLAFNEYELSNLASPVSDDFSYGYNQKGMAIARQWIQGIGDKLVQFKSNPTESKVATFQRLFDLVKDVVGKENAPAVFHILKRHGLIVQKQEWMVHQNVYQSIVDVFGSKKVFNSRDTYREKVRKQLYAGIEYMIQNEIGTDDIKFWRVESQLRKEYPDIQSLTTMWECDRIDILGNYFLNAVTDQDVLDYFDIEEIIDYIIFQNSIYYMHRPLNACAGGGQDTPWKEWKTVQENLIKSRKNKGGFPLETTF